MRKTKITRSETIFKKIQYELRKRTNLVRRTQKDPSESKTYGNELKKRKNLVRRVKKNPPSWKKCGETIIEKKHYELRKRKNLVRTQKDPPGSKKYENELRKKKKIVRRVQKNPPGWKKCGKSCRICPYTIENTETVTGLASGFKHTIKQAVTCESENVIYYWKCTKRNCDVYPECEYIGKTKRKFRDRLSEHRYYLKYDVTTPSGSHFTKRGHNVSHLKGLVLEKVESRDPQILRRKEHLMIKKFDTFKHGLNQEP